MLFSQMGPPAGREQEFHRWYDDEHIPARLQLQGFSGATRYREVEGRPEAHLAVYEIDDLAVLETPEYQALKSDPSPLTTDMLSSVSPFTRYICETVSDTGRVPSHNFLSVVAFEVPEDEMDAFDEWYEAEHTPLLKAADDWLRVSRYRRLSGDGESYNAFALHELHSTEVLDGPERARARSGPLRAALAERPWFKAGGRWLYEVIRQARPAAG